VRTNCESSVCWNSVRFEQWCRENWTIMRERGEVLDGKGLCWVGVGGCSKILLTCNPISGPRIAGFAWADARSRRRVHELISEPVWLDGGWTTVICCTKGCWWDGKGVWRGRGKEGGVVARLIRELGRGQLTTKMAQTSRRRTEQEAGEIDLELVPNPANLDSAVSLANRLLPHTSFSLSLLSLLSRCVLHHIDRPASPFKAIGHLQCEDIEISQCAKTPPKTAILHPFTKR
jgi:hypothetical protein